MGHGQDAAALAGSVDTSVDTTLPGKKGSAWKETPFHYTPALCVPKQPCCGAPYNIEARRVTSSSLPRSSEHRKSTGKGSSAWTVGHGGVSASGHGGELGSAVQWHRSCQMTIGIYESYISITQF